MSGLKRRTVQLWAEAGALVAEPASERQGSGVHRVFGRDEAIICIMLAQLEWIRTPIGRIKSIGEMFRRRLKHDEFFRSNIEAIINSKKAGALGLYADGKDVCWFDSGDHRLEVDIPTKYTKMVIIVSLDDALSALR